MINDPLIEDWFELLLKYYIGNNDTMVVGNIWVAGKQDSGLVAQKGDPPGGSTDQVVPGVSALE